MTAQTTTFSSMTIVDLYLLDQDGNEIMHYDQSGAGWDFPGNATGSVYPLATLVTP